MCVKEFLGYNCGHCSIPILRQCPLSMANEVFPTCTLPAERPIFTDEYCHPCSRVVWNMKVLREEEEHRGRHLRGECECEVIFDGEDKSRRTRSRGRGKGKARAHSSDVVEYSTEENQRYAPESQVAQDIQDHGSFDLVGFYVGVGEVQMADPQNSYAPVGGYTVSSGQLLAGQLGAGMKWHTQEPSRYHRAALPYRPRPKGVKSFSGGQKDIEQCESTPFSTKRRRSKAASDKVLSKFDAVDAKDCDDGGKSDCQSPAVVSSEMVRPEST